MTKHNLDEVSLIDSYYVPSGRCLAEGVTADEFMASFDGQRVEWSEGYVIEMPSVDKFHDELQKFFIIFFSAILEKLGGGTVVFDPMLMRLDGSRRAPDIQVLLQTSMDKLQQTQVAGPADLVIEIVSHGSQTIDRVDKFYEYQRGGVPEYWIIDPLFNEALFYVLNEQGEYQRIAPDNGIYTSHILPPLKLPVATLWQHPLPTLTQTLAMVTGMTQA